MPALPSPETLEAYRALVESADDSILIADWDTARFVDANRIALDRLGYSMAELRQMTGGDLSQFPREEHRRFSSELIELGETHARGVPIRCKDGSLLHMDLWVKKFVVDGAAYHANVLRDAVPSPHEDDERFRIARGRLLESEAFYRGVVTCTEDALIVTDFVTGECIEANPAACTMFGYTTVQWGEVTRYDLHSPADRKVVEDIEGELRRTGGSRAIETRLVRRDGSSFVVDTMNSVFESGGRKLIVTTIRDVTERRSQSQLLERSQRLAAVGEVAAGVIHEINNPAAFVLMNCDVLDEQVARVERCVKQLAAVLDREEDPDRRKQLEALQQHAPDLPTLRDAMRDNRDGVERIRAVTRDLRHFSRIDDTGTVEVDLNAVVGGALNLLRNELRHHARVIVELADDLPRLVAQRGKLGQVVTNLLLNASQAITEGSADANMIRVTTDLDGEEVVLAVEDSGVGMDEQTLSHVFEPFFTTKPTELGTGLGLPLCAEIVSKHRGRIDVKSRKGHGSRFEVRLPLDTGLTVSNETPSVLPPPPSHRSRILVVDDDPGMVRAYRRMLRDYPTTVASSGKETLSLLADDEDYDLILCDLMMPDVDGPQVYEALMERTPHLARRIVFCTGGVFTPRVREFLDGIENEVIDKPLTREDLARLLGPHD